MQFWKSWRLPAPKPRTMASLCGRSLRTACRVLGDRVQLQQVMLNLIVNAIEAMRSLGEGNRDLLICTRKAEQNDVLVEVLDSGPGVLPATVERLFESFCTTKQTGLGLGLSICRSIVEAHNGRLWASPSVPRGAIFHFTVPAHADGGT